MITSYYISNSYLFSCWEFVICMDLWHTNQELFIQHVLARIFPCFFYCLNPCWLYRKLLSQRLEKEVVYGQNYSGKIPKGYLFWIIRHFKTWRLQIQRRYHPSGLAAWLITILFLYAIHTTKSCLNIEKCEKSTKKLMGRVKLL